MNQTLHLVLLFFASTATGYLVGVTGREEAPSAPSAETPTNHGSQATSTWKAEREQMISRMGELEALLAVITPLESSEGQAARSESALQRPFGTTPQAGAKGLPAEGAETGVLDPARIGGADRLPTVQPPMDTPELRKIAKAFNEGVRKFHSAAQTEPIDPEWAYLAAEEIITAYTTHDPPQGTAIASVECRTSLCRLRVTGEPGVDWQAFGPYLWNIRKETVHSSYSLSYIDDSKTFATAYYERREPTTP